MKVGVVAFGVAVFGFGAAVASFGGVGPGTVKISVKASVVVLGGQLRQWSSNRRNFGFAFKHLAYFP